MSATSLQPLLPVRSIEQRLPGVIEATISSSRFSPALPDGHIDFLNQGRCEYTVLLLPKPVAAGAAERIYDNSTFTCVSGR
jgi:hypothetical protein